MSSRDKVQARRLKGFQDYHPSVMQMRYKIMDIIREEASKASFKPVGTPALEYSEVLLGVGGETDKQVFRFHDNGERDVALRFDLTVPFARYVAEHQGSLNFPFKRLQIGDVWRAEKPQKGRYREFCQCDLDIVGVNSIEADTEILFCFISILNRIDIGPFTMAIGHRLILSALIAKTLGIKDKGLENKALIIIDKLDKIGRDKVVSQLDELPGSKTGGGAVLVDAIADKDPQTGTKLYKVAQLLAGDTQCMQILEQMQSSVEVLSDLNKDGQGKIIIDLSIARGLGYYTGICFETNIDSLPGFGSICSGGRYNQLVERYLNRELPGIGGSIGLDRLMAGLQELNKIPADLNQDTVFIAIASEKARGPAFNLLQSLRQENFKADIALKTNKLANQFKYANRQGYPVVLTLGDDEISQNTVSIKIMATGDEKKNVPQSQLFDTLKEIMAI